MLSPTDLFPASEFSSLSSNDGKGKAKFALPMNLPLSADQELRPNCPVRRHLRSMMPASRGSQSLLASLPSVMSVVGDGANNHQMKEGGSNHHKRPSSSHHPFSPTFRRDSASTFDSVDSSPTTTVSTLESSLTDPSPSSSPESPKPTSHLPPFKPSRNYSFPAVRPIMEKHQFSSSFPLLPAVDRTESPNKKMRNTKNLSVNTAASNRQASHLSRLALSNGPSSSAGHASSAPATPAFIVPPKAPRKKPSNLGLTITTPDSGSSVNSQTEKPAAVPQTPSEPPMRTLRLLQTSSNGPLFSPTHAPEGGMRLPPLANSSTNSRFGRASRPPLSVSPLSSFDTNNSSPITKQTLDHVQEEMDYELPLSQEAKSPAYPQGPICIYDPHVFLYLEPTQFEARAFDVVINVAREVKNPFSDPATNAPMQTQTENTEGAAHDDVCLAGQDSMSEPSISRFDQEVTINQLKGAATSNPETPKATPPEPEYIHVPWDHNANVVDDLLRLCQTIEDRVQRDKKVLIHCQCGVSRSASLVVAYGIYRNPQLTVQEAYDAVKNRSRWIGPNMNLIYQLSEFKGKLAEAAPRAAAHWHSWRSIDSSQLNRSGLALNDPACPPTSARAIPQKSLSVPSNAEIIPTSGRSGSFSASSSKFLSVGPTAGDITPGPSSAPPHVLWSPPVDTSAIQTSGPTKADDEVSQGVSNTLMDLDVDLSLSPLAVEGETIGEKRLPPARAIANDLQEVAKDLNARSTPEPSCFTVQGTKDFDPAKKPHSELIPQTKTAGRQPHATVPSLPAGFSSLLSRRQGAQCLPIRQEISHFTPIDLPPSGFSPILRDDVPPTPSILSPRATEFTASPFHRTAAGDLAGSSVFEQGLMSPKAVDEDPRSPHHRGEAPIMRGIFDMLEGQPKP